MSHNQPLSSSSDSREFLIRAWCEENGAEVEYVIEHTSRLLAIEQAVDKFRHDCGRAAAYYVPPPHRVQTEVLEEAEL